MPCVVCPCQWLTRLPHLLGAHPLKSVLQVTSPHAHPTGRCACLVSCGPSSSPTHTLGVVAGILFPSGLLGISVSPPEVQLAVGEERTGGGGSWAVDTPALRSPRPPREQLRAGPSPGKADPGSLMHV